ncbi:MAG: CoA-binding protein [Blautia sp.]
MEFNLNKLLKPRTVAIVGASEKAGFGGDTTRNYLKFSKNLDNVYFVNPGRDTVLGYPAYHTLAEIPVDVVFGDFVYASEDDLTAPGAGSREKMWRRHDFCQRLQRSRP